MLSYSLTTEALWSSSPEPAAPMNMRSGQLLARAEGGPAMISTAASRTNIVARIPGLGPILWSTVFGSLMTVLETGWTSGVVRVSGLALVFPAATSTGAGVAAPSRELLEGDVVVPRLAVFGPIAAPISPLDSHRLVAGKAVSG